MALLGCPCLERVRAASGVPVICFWTWDLGDVDGSVCGGSSSRTLMMGILFCNTCHASITLKLKKRKRISAPDLLSAEVELLLDGRMSLRVVIPEYHRLGGFSTTEVYSSWFWRLETQDLRAQFLVHRQPSSHYVLAWQKRGRELCGVSFIRSPISFMRAPPFCPPHLPNALPPDAIALGLGLNIQIWGRPKHLVQNRPLRYVVNTRVLL